VHWPTSLRTTAPGRTPGHEPGATGSADTRRSGAPPAPRAPSLGGAPPAGFEPCSPPAPRFALPGVVQVRWPARLSCLRRALRDAAWARLRAIRCRRARSARSRARQRRTRALARRVLCLRTLCALERRSVRRARAKRRLQLRTRRARRALRAVARRSLVPRFSLACALAADGVELPAGRAPALALVPVSVAPPARASSTIAHAAIATRSVRFVIPLPPLSLRPHQSGRACAIDRIDHERAREPATAGAHPRAAHRGAEPGR
jgi:hypothetical protein